MAASAPSVAAVVVSKRSGAALRYDSITFAELESLSNRYANALNAAGTTRGSRTLLMVRQGFDFIALVFALFKIGAIPVLIDPGMGVTRLLECIRTAHLDAFVGIPLAHAVRTLRPASFAAVKTIVTVGRRWFWGGPTLSVLARDASDRFEMAPTRDDEPAAILFTSGSTGPAKGVVYTHGMFDAQVRMIQSTYNIQPGEIDLPTFPLFALFSVAMGMTIVLPDMDPSHPARVNPANIVAAIRDQKVTNTFGSPALWKRVAAHCNERGITLPTLRRILIAGAPVPPAVIEQLHGILSSDADVHTPYGATESLPVSTISGNEVVGSKVRSRGGKAMGQKGNKANLEHETEGTLPHYHLTTLPNDGNDQRRSAIDNSVSTVSATICGAGTCVGLPVEGTDITILRITDEPIAEWSDDLIAPDGEVGEICVTGPSITHEYFGLPRANALAKIIEGATVWHRIGDVGYLDENDRLWFCGRKAHRVQTPSGTLFTECIEPIINQHPAVARCALVGVGPPRRQTPVLIVELKPGHPRGKRALILLTDEILKSFDGLFRQSQLADDPSSTPSFSCVCTEIGRKQVALLHSSIDNRHSPILYRPSLPVDIRHNAKINRELLAAWAAKSF